MGHLVILANTYRDCYIKKKLLWLMWQTDVVNSMLIFTEQLHRDDESLQTAPNIYQECSHQKPLGEVYQLYTGLHLHI